MQITYYGHSCFLVETAQGIRLLFDPFITGNELAKDKVDINSIQADFIFLSHAHLDHVLDAETIARRAQIPIIGVWEIHDYYSKRGLQTVPMNVGGTYYHPNRQATELQVKLVPAVHTSSFADGTYGGVPVGFVIHDGQQVIYYAGDTALTLEMELIAERYQLDLAILPVGGHFTMDVEDAVEAALLLDVSQVLGVHYNTFPPIAIDTAQAQEKFKEVGITLHLPAIGSTLAVTSEVSDES